MIKIFWFFLLINFAEIFSFNKQLYDELLAMMQEDQAHRRSYIEKGQSNESLLCEIGKLNSQHISRLKVVIQEMGWPGIHLVGIDGDQAAWLLVQHADDDLPFQLNCLGLLEAQLVQGNTSPQNVAYLTDRILINQGKKQRYGTQFKIKDNIMILDPIEKEEEVDARRKAMGLCSLSEYMRQSSELLKK